MRHSRIKPTEIATSCPVDGSFLEIDQRIQSLPAQTDSAREQNPKIKTSEVELATIYPTPINAQGTTEVIASEPQLGRFMTIVLSGIHQACIGLCGSERRIDIEES